MQQNTSSNIQMIINVYLYTVPLDTSNGSDKMITIITMPTIWHQQELRVLSNVINAGLRMIIIFEH